MFAKCEEQIIDVIRDEGQEQEILNLGEPGSQIVQTIFNISVWAQPIDISTQLHFLSSISTYDQADTIKFFTKPKAR